MIWHKTKVKHEDIFQGVDSTQIPCLKHLRKDRVTIPSYSKPLWRKKMQPWSFATWERKSWRGELWWLLVFSGTNSSGQTGKIQLEQAKYGANTKARISFFFSLWGHNFGLNAQSLKWIAWREWLWCDNHSQVNLSSVTSAQGIQCAISRKTKKRYRKECFLNNVPALICWLISTHLKARL